MKKANTMRKEIFDETGEPLFEYVSEQGENFLMLYLKNNGGREPEILAYGKKISLKRSEKSLLMNWEASPEGVNYLKEQAIGFIRATIISDKRMGFYGKHIGKREKTIREIELNKRKVRAGDSHLAIAENWEKRVNDSFNF